MKKPSEIDQLKKHKKGVGSEKPPLMYADEKGERLPTWNPHPGCGFDCYYCYGKQTYERSKCPLCRAFRPHFHPERMAQKFEKGKTYFVESLGDPAFIPPAIFQQILDHLAEFPGTTFMLQSKNPKCFIEEAYKYPANVWLGTTIETNLEKLARCYSKAPGILERFHWLCKVQEAHPELHYYVTFEPIMTCQILELLDIALYLHADAVYVGRENHEHCLPEPAEYELVELVRQLKEKLGPERVHTKTLGLAWWEKR